MSKELENFITSNREAFDNRVPDPAVLERIQQQMQGIVVKKKEKAILVPMRVLRLAAACFVLLAGAGIFWLLQKDDTTQPAVTASVQPATVQPKTIDTQARANTVTAAPVNDHTASTDTYSDKVAEMEAAMTERKRVMFAKLNDMQSPSQRMIGAAEVQKLKNADIDIVDALANTLNNDPSTNVRLAALDALGKFHREAYVKKKLIASLKNQKDPMVQIGLIELLTKMREKTILNELDKIVNDRNAMDAVKDHAYTSIFTLKS